MHSDTPVLVLGMHRSGTSCLTGCLQEMGLHLGEVHVWNPFNLKGNRERKDVMALNDALLRDHGGSWDAPVLVDSGNAAQRRERERIIDELRSGDRPWGFKDPRTLFTLPFWETGLPGAYLVATFRHPLAVADSLVFRNGFSRDRGLTLWARYNQRLLELAAARRLLMISFDLPAPEYYDRLHWLARRLGLSGNVRPGFFDPQLRRSHPDDGVLKDEYRRLYQRLLTEAEASFAA